MLTDESPIFAGMARVANASKRRSDETTVVFVDDEQNVLNGIFRNVSKSRKDWNVQVFADPHEALEYIGSHPVDVVVSDMRMPKLSGIEFLTSVIGINSNTVRIALSGYASFESTLDALKMVHRFVEKPVEPKALVNLIERSIALRDELLDKNVHSLLMNLDTIPSNPLHQSEIRTLASSQSGDAAELAGLIEHDVGLVANLFRIANAKSIGSGSEISSVLQAVELIGVKTARNLVVSNGLYSQLESDKCDQHDALIQASNLISTLSRQLAEDSDLDWMTVDRCELAGMLVTLGDIVVLANQHKFPDVATVKPEQIGGAILKMWMFSDPIVEAVAGHRDAANDPSFRSETGPDTFSCVSAAWMGWRYLSAETEAEQGALEGELKAACERLSGDSALADRWYRTTLALKA